MWKNSVLRENVPHTRIALAALGNEAGIIGAALMAAESDAE
jgi:hypothetical protein